MKVKDIQKRLTSKILWQKKSHPLSWMAFHINYGQSSFSILCKYQSGLQQ